MNNNNLGLSTEKVTQFSIQEKIDQQKIEKLFLNKIHEMDKYLRNNNDIFGNEILNHLKKKRKIIFSLNKPEEIFITKYQNNLLTSCINNIKNDMRIN